MCVANIAVFIFLILVGVVLGLLVWRGKIKNNTLERVALVAGIVAALAAIAVLVVPPARLPICEQTPTSVPTIVQTDCLHITKPENNTPVGFEEEVQGTSCYGNLYHYLVVKPANGDAYVQERVLIGPNGAWMGRARFGTIFGVGVGQQFTIYMIATQSSLPIDVLVSTPKEALYSDSVSVTRTH